MTKQETIAKWKMEAEEIGIEFLRKSNKKSYCIYKKTCGCEVESAYGNIRKKFVPRCECLWKESAKELGMEFVRHTRPNKSIYKKECGCEIEYWDYEVCSRRSKPWCECQWKDNANAIGLEYIKHTNRNKSIYRKKCGCEIECWDGAIKLGKIPRCKHQVDEVFGGFKPYMLATFYTVDLGDGKCGFGITNRPKERLAEHKKTFLDLRINSGEFEMSCGYGNRVASLEKWIKTNIELIPTSIPGFLTECVDIIHMDKIKEMTKYYCDWF